MQACVYSGECEVIASFYRDWRVADLRVQKGAAYILSSCILLAPSAFSVLQFIIAIGPISAAF